MARRKLGTSNTTISISWEDKDEFRKFAKLVKKTRNGGESNSTYPKIQVHDQQD